VDIPEVMVSKRIDDLVRDFEMRIQYQGLDLNKYLEIMGMDYNTFRGQFSKRAEDEVKTQLVLEKISQVENIEVTDEDVDNEIKTMAENYKQNAEEFKKHLSEDDIEYIKESNKMKKAIDFLVENTKFVE
jgi:trigger factor